MHDCVGRKFEIEAFKETGVVERFGGLIGSLRTRELKKWALTYHRNRCQEAVGSQLGLAKTQGRTLWVFI